MRRLAAIVFSTAIAATMFVAPAPAAPSTPSWVANATIYEVNIRQYTPEGTFNAFAKQLPRLQQLGVGILWLMPIQPISVKNRKGTLGSPYSVANYKQVNPDYGTNADFTALVAQAHALGMHVILDWVANHTGWDNPWIANKSWYTQDSSGNIIWPAGTDWNDVADLNYDNADMRAAMIDAMRYWVTEFDIDGFRCDVAGSVPTDFWESASHELHKYKHVFMLAEDDSNLSLLDNAFTANYGWKFMKFANGVSGGSAMRYEFTGYLANQRNSYDEGTYPMLFITNHDENSWNGTEFKRLGAAVKPLAALTFIAPGIPMLYNGQEVGFNRQLQFFEKDPITWTASPAWTNFFTKLIAFRKAHPSLWSGVAAGSVTTLKNDNAQVISLLRQKASDKVVYVMNLSSKAQKVTVAAAAGAGALLDYATGKRAVLKKSQKLVLKPFEYRIWSTPAVA